MSKPFALIYSLISVALMTATAISISSSAALSLTLALVTALFIGAGFMIKSRLKKN